jgi:hypothetical protein
MLKSGKWVENKWKVRRLFSCLVEENVKGEWEERKKDQIDTF